MKTQSHFGPSVILFFSTALWGIFWWPLRHIENAGISGVWAVVAINMVPLLFLVPLVIVRRKKFFNHIKAKCFIGIAMGGGMAFYAMAFLYTNVLRTTLLFYMSPVWATLLAILILKEKTTYWRWLAIAVGFSGLVLILIDKGASDVTQAFNRGDLFAVLSGLLWGYGTVLVRKSTDIPAIDIVPNQYFWAMLISTFVLLTTAGSPEFRVPNPEQWLNALPLIIGFYVIITLPTIFICTRISQILSPGRACLLMMSEVLVAGISAPLIAGESISAVEWTAGFLIVAATLIEVYSPQTEQLT